MKRNLAISVVLIVTFVLIACSGSSALAGRWAIEPGQPTRDNIEDMELLKDGTGIVDKVGISWKVDNGRFYITHPLRAGSWGYKISGKTLTLITDDGTSLTYKKK